MAQKYSYRPLLSPQSTRVLLLQSDRSHHANIHITLEGVSLDLENSSFRPYDALSYVWGSPTGNQPIFCEGKEILVTSNCESALRHLRHKRKTVVLWIDTICIDQQNADEKALQIPLMGEIYRRATEVTIWLGEGDRKMTRCLALQKRIPFDPYRILGALPVRCLRPTFFLLYGGTRPEDLKAFRNFE
jgi:Heterokaryon incompatibility protein (HET)